MITNSLDAAVAQRTAAHHQAAPSAKPVIEVSGLHKRYGEHEAVRGVDLEVVRGEIFAFLGPNGAGKTTTVEILEGFRTPSSGTVRVLGAEVSEQRAGSLSGGQRRRLDVALALIGDPDLIFLDEPTTGFDPSARRAAWDVIDGLRQLGKTVFLTTHYMEEAERLADRIAIIAAGRIIAQGTPRTLGGRDSSEARITFTLPPGTTALDLPSPLAEHADVQDEDRVLASSDAVATDLSILSSWALARGSQLEDLEVRRATLEDTYLELVSQHQTDRS